MSNGTDRTTTKAALAIGALVSVVTGCAASNPASNPAMIAAHPGDTPAPTCVVSIYSTAPPFEVDDLGPIQANCPDPRDRPLPCGIDQANLPQVACSSGADTVFGVYETMEAAPAWYARPVRKVHARLGKRRHAELSQVVR